MRNSIFPFEILSYVTLLLVLAISAGLSSAQEGQEETYSMDFVQTAELNKDILEVGDKKVLTENYTVHEGDHIWQIFREKGLLEKNNLYEIIAILKKLNSSLDNIDLIHPGQTIIIPLQISPTAGSSGSLKRVASTPLSIAELKDKDIRNYTVRSGDSITKVVNDLFNVPPNELYNEYLKALKDLNPEIENIDKIYPGQSVRLPIYSPKVVRMPIKAQPVTSLEGSAGSEELKEMSGKLQEIFTLLGEEWINSGKHFIPLKTGGQISLNADSYPVVNLVNGNKIIVDINDDLPEKISSLIKSNWDNYYIVHFKKNNDLRQSVDDILSKCGYEKVYRSGESFNIDGDIPIRINADWIIKVGNGLTESKPGFVVLNILDEIPRIPSSIIKYLEGINIKVIEYPIKESFYDSDEEADIFYSHENRSIVETLLDNEGLKYSTDIEIPIYQSKQEDFKLIIKADFLMDMGGRDLIIDISGLGKEIIDLLKEHGFRVLQLQMETDPSSIIKQTLDFLNINYDPLSHEFPAANRSGENNIYLKIPGIIFTDKEAKKIFATPLNLSSDISGFLTSKGYRIMMLSQAD